MCIGHEIATTNVATNKLIIIWDFMVCHITPSVSF